MVKVNVLAFAALTTALLWSASVAPAQVAIDVNIGPAPICPYGYYGPDWFVGGLFLGAGPWFHGPHGFVGHVDNRFDPHHGYAGPVPEHGAQRFNHFQANEARDGRGNVANAPHEGKGEHALPGYRGSAHGGGHH